MQSRVRRAAARMLKESPVLPAALHVNVSRAPQLPPPPHSCATLLPVLLKAFVEIKGLLGLSLKRLLLASSFQETALTFYQQVLLSSLLMTSFDVTWTLTGAFKTQTTKPVLFPFLIHRATQSKLLTPRF